MRLQASKILLVASLLAYSAAVPAKTFSLLLPTSQVNCDTMVNEFSTGQQYVDPNNGVPYNRWSMLVRWQGTTIPGPTGWINHAATMDFGSLTGLHVPYPYSNWQRGYSPESVAAATPVVQMHCDDAGMLVNSWAAPHQAVLGGGWNDMYGYAWSPQERPKAFQWIKVVPPGIIVSTPADLVIQGLFAMPNAAGFIQNNDGTWAQVNNLNSSNPLVAIQYAMFAYIRDTSHQELHPIALLAGIYGNGHLPSGCFSYVGYDYPDGVWYASSLIQKPSVCDDSLYGTTKYTGAYTTNTLFSSQKFFRIHFTPDDLENVVEAINGFSCAHGSCPEKGYSTDPADYVLDYYGVILETTVCHATSSNTRVCSTKYSDRQVSAAARASGVFAYSYHD